MFRISSSDPEAGRAASGQVSCLLPSPVSVSTRGIRPLERFSQDRKNQCRDASRNAFGINRTRTGEDFTSRRTQAATTFLYGILDVKQKFAKAVERSVGVDASSKTTDSAKSTEVRTETPNRIFETAPGRPVDVVREREVPAPTRLTTQLC
jgi:hypothetical protein